MMALMLTALVAAQQASAKAVPTGYRIEEGNWGGGSYNEESGAFAFCFIGTKTKSGNRIAVFLLSDATLWLSIANDSWSLAPGDIYGGRVEADTTRRYISGVVKMNSVVYDFQQDPAFFDAMRNGEELLFLGSVGQISISLRPDTFGALTALEACLAKHTGLDLQGRLVSGGAQNGGNPFAGSAATAPAPGSGGGASSQNPFAFSAPVPAPAPSTQSAVAPDADSIAELRGLLMQAGYPNPQMVDLRDNEGDFLFGWTSAGTDLIGFLAGGLPQDGDYRAALDAETRSLRADCGARGQTIYDPATETYEGKPVYSGRVDCGDDAFAIYFVIVAMDRTVLKFYHVADRGSMAMGQQVNANLRNRLREP